MISPGIAARQNKRRKFLVALGSACAAPLASAFAQQQKVWRVGWIAIGSPTSRTSLFLDAVKLGLRELGYVEGRNLEIEARWAAAAILKTAKALGVAIPKAVLLRADEVIE